MLLGTWQLYVHSRMLIMYVCWHDLVQIKLSRFYAEIVRIRLVIGSNLRSLIDPVASAALVDVQFIGRHSRIAHVFLVLD